MQLVRITGPTAAMRLLGEVEGLDFERTSASRIDEDSWQVAAYVTDEALAELKTRGLSTALVAASDTLSAQRAELFAQITRDEDEA